MRYLFILLTAFLASCSTEHYFVDNPYDVTSAVGRRALHGKLIQPGLVDIQAPDDYIGQPVRDPNKNIVGYVTSTVPCETNKRGCLHYKELK